MCKPPLVLDRSNFLFCGNHYVAICTVIIYSLVDSCKALGVMSYTMLNLSRLFAFLPASLGCQCDACIV